MAPYSIAEFGSLFARGLEDAACEADRQLGGRVPRAFIVELHGAGHPGDRMEFEQALNSIYLSDERFYRIIDIAVREVTAANTIVFVRVSDHTPGDFEETWNPQERGPFKQLIPMKIVDQRDPER
jgi:hypothetical protein